MLPLIHPKGFTRLLLKTHVIVTKLWYWLKFVKGSGRRGSHQDGISESNVHSWAWAPSEICLVHWYFLHWSTQIQLVNFFFLTIFQVHICYIIWVKWKLFSSPVHIGKESCKCRVLWNHHLNKLLLALPVPTRIGCLESRSPFSGCSVGLFWFGFIKKASTAWSGSPSPEQHPAAHLPNPDKLEPGGRHFVFSRDSTLFAPHSTVLYGGMCSFKKGDSSNLVQLMATPSISENMKGVCLSLLSLHMWAKMNILKLALYVLVSFHGKEMLIQGLRGVSKSFLKNGQY